MRLIGREPELAVIDGLLARLARREGGALLVHGDAGIGKSALLDEAATRAGASGATVLRTAGVPSETPMPFAGLHRLLRPRLRRIAELPEPQRQALSAAFGLSDAAAPDRFLIALAALELLADAAAESPLLLVAEDAHWLDRDTCDALAFIARRVELEPIALLFATRDGQPGGLVEAGLLDLGLTGLDDEASALLVETYAPGLPWPAVRRLLDTAAGNPLALLELPRALSAEPSAGASARVPLPITDTLERAFSERLSALPPITQDVLLIVALDDGGHLAKILHAASALRREPVGAGALDSAEAAGLVELVEGEARFRHPLVRAAMYHAAQTGARIAAHAALAEAYRTDPDRSVWHRAAACAGPDDAIAAEVAGVAARALRRGSPAVAAAGFEHAARLSEDPGGRADLLLRAAEIEFELGHPDLALRLLDQARTLVLSERERARLTLLFETAHEAGWEGPDHVASFAAVASRLVSPDDPERAIAALLAVARDCWWGNARQETRDLVVATAVALRLPDDNPALIAVLSCADPVHRSQYVLDQLSRTAPQPGGDPAAMHLLGTAATTAWAFDSALGFLAAAVEGLREQGRLGLLAQALVSQAWAAVHAAHTMLAVSAADEAASLARETGQTRWAVAADLAQATIAGERGDLDTAAALTERAEEELRPLSAQPMLALAAFARGRSAVANQLYEEGYGHLRRTLDPADVAYHPFVGSWGLADLIESAARTGRAEQAAKQLVRLESLTAKTGAPFLRATLAYARPLVSADAEAEPLYLSALDHELPRWPCYRTRLLLSYGRWLRRQRRVADSRAPLRAARSAGLALAFDGLAEIAAQELRASGEASGSRDADLRDQLTPQELQIAQMAGQGLSNREIGQRLYLSHRTVGSHLYRIFPKLGITSRGQISGVLAPPEQETTQRAPVLID